jgi:hypothetical protein
MSMPTMNYINETTSLLRPDTLAEVTLTGVMRRKDPVDSVVAGKGVGQQLSGAET